MHHILESSIGEKCKCGKPASHKVEEVLDFGSFSTIDEAVNAGVRHPLTMYLCCQCFSSLMGDPFNWCGLTYAAPDAGGQQPKTDETEPLLDPLYEVLYQMDDDIELLKKNADAKAQT